MLKLEIEIELPEGVTAEEVIKSVATSRKNEQRVRARRAAQQGIQMPMVDAKLSDEQFIIDQIRVGILSEYITQQTEDAGKIAKTEKRKELSEKFKGLKAVK
jgi:hypothetical protein